uniref:C-type lectin domain-containing protein n=1 Tax=Varanus komodoensis TaxID=61221 RepID=A0A8D2JIK8_VARKO
MYPQPLCPCLASESDPSLPKCLAEGSLEVQHLSSKVRHHHGSAEVSGLSILLAPERILPTRGRSCSSLSKTPSFSFNFFSLSLSSVYPCGSRSREWEYFDGRCYYFGIEAVPWHTAKSHCEERNSKLVVIQDEPEQNFIQSQTKGERYWIGLSDVNVEGEWKWIDDTDYRTSYKNWKSGEPNDHGDHGEDCAQVSSAGQWNDLRCNTASFYVCEKPLPS